MKTNFLTHLKWKQQDLWTIYNLTFKEFATYSLQAVAFIAIVSYLFYKNLIFVIFLSPFIHFYLRKKSKEIEIKNKRVLGMQFKDGMIAVSFALNVGYSIENAFREAYGEVILLYGKDSNIAKEFAIIIKRIDMNENIENILEDFARRSEIEDILYFSEIFKYAKRSGGDLISIIKNTAKNISEKQEVMQEIETVISGKRLEQRVMTVIPFGIILYLKLTAPEFINPLYNNHVGIVIMTVCLVIYLIANSMAEKIVNIEV